MLGSELREIRTRRKMSLRELAAEADISVEAVSAIERGARYPNLHTLERLARVLDIRIVIGPQDTIIEID